MEEFLNSIWSENNFPAKAKLLKLAREQRPDTQPKDVNKFLDAQLSYQLLKETKNLKSHLGHIVAFHINEIWQIDLYDLSRYETTNKKYKYMFAVMDVFSRFAYIIPIKNKDIETTTKALEEVLSYNKTAPNLIMSDNDSSFLGGEFQKVLVKNNIHHNPNAVGDHNSLGIIDNFAKRIKRILTAQFLQTKKTNWIDIIQKIVRMYNYSPHSSLGGLTPAEIMSGDDKDANSFIVMVNSYKSQFNGAATDLKIGDKVRIKLSGDFQKGTDPRYSGKVYTVKEIYGKNIILDNDKKYVRPQLLQVPANSVSDERPNTIQKAKTAKKVRQFLKSNDHTVKTLPAQLIRRSLPRKAKEKN
jgi:hypothetical protein